MQTLAQGLVGLADAFIHPNYVSAAYPMEGLGMIALVSLIVGFVLFTIAVHMFEKWWAKKKADLRTGPSPLMRKST